MSMLDLARFRQEPLIRKPFDHLVVPRFLAPEVFENVFHDFPEVSVPGSLPASELAYGPAFARLLEELQGAELTEAVAEKFEIDLSHRPTMLTVRGKARAKDGRIHTDSRTKLITILIYLNPSWSDPGGHVRLLRSAEDLEDYVADVAPEHGNLVAFRCTDAAFHGHTPFVGDRRVIQLNWVTDRSVVTREERRHRFSARMKSLWLSGRSSSRL